VIFEFRWKIMTVIFYSQLT